MSGKIFFKANSEARKLASWKIAASLVASAILDAAKSTIKAIVNRRSVNALASWDDRMLKDIGLTRGDLDSVLTQPWHRDPSRDLMVRRLENRRNRSVGYATRQNGATGDPASERRCGVRPAGSSAREFN